MGFGVSSAYLREPVGNYFCGMALDGSVDWMHSLLTDQPTYRTPTYRTPTYRLVTPFL
ncbi:MAG: hypothetical protein AAF639_30255 [Chloroflexota bacterium]